MTTPELVQAQRTYFETGATRSAEFRLAALKKLQDEANFGKLMYMNELFKTMPMGDVWNEYLARQGMNNEWYAEVEKYEKEVLSLRK